MPTAKVVRVCTNGCERNIGGRGVVLGKESCRLPAEDFCRHCARPISERGERLSDHAGFVKFVRDHLAQRQPAQRVARDRLVWRKDVSG